MNRVEVPQVPRAVVALIGAIGVGVAWLALATSTSLIFHLMPAGPPLLAGFLLRGDEARSWVAGVVVGAAALVSLAVLVGLARLGRPLDDVSWGLAIVAVGAAAGWTLARHGSGAATER